MLSLIISTCSVSHLVDATVFDVKFQLRFQVFYPVVKHALGVKDLFEVTQSKVLEKGVDIGF